MVGVASQVKEQIAAVHYEARRIADEKKAKASQASTSTAEGDKPAEKTA